MWMRLRFRDEKPPSRLERRFLLYWQSLGGPPLEREIRFHAERKWRADFAHVESRTLIEVEGGIYIQGRHNRPQGFAADAEKYLEAALADWRVLRLTELQITAPMIERIIRFLRVDIGTKPHGHTSSTTPPRSHPPEHERTDAPAEHPRIEDGESAP
jgi:very-short-patch-repair endonuclease